MFCLPKTAWPPTYSDEGLVTVGLKLALVFSVRPLAGFEFVLSSSLGQDGFRVV